MLKEVFLTTDLLLLLAMILSLASFYVAKFRINFAEAVAMTPISITLCLFLFGVLGILKLGLYLVNFTIVGLFVYSLLLIKKDLKNLH